MKKNVESQEIKESLERFTLIMYSLYHVRILVASIYKGWEAWCSAVVLAAFAAGWIVSLFRRENKHFQAGFGVTMIMISELIFAMHAESLELVFVSFLCIVIVTGLYGYTDILSIPLLTFVIMVLYHIFVLGSFADYRAVDILSSALSIISMLLAIWVIIYWARRGNETYRKLLRVIRELQTAERSKDDFLANVSHEIRTPINTISGMSEILLQEEEPVRLKEDIQMIQLAGRNLMRVVSDILDFSELQAGELEIVEEAYDVTSCVNDLVNMCNAIKADKNLELIVDLDCGIPRSLLGDEKKIRRVIMNLVSNAIKFTNEGGVSISIAFRREYYGINLIVTVSDTGIGMEQKSLEKLFTTYNQVDTSRRRQNGGVGLGLAISQVIVHNMGGVIKVKSRIKKGTVIKVTIPQKILDEQPIAKFDYPDSVRMVCYMDMEQFETRNVRDTYMEMSRHMIAQLGVYGRVSRNLPELKRRMEQEGFSHVFIGLHEYEQDPEYFTMLAGRTHVIVALDRGQEKKLKSGELLCMYTPFYILPIISVLNATTDTGKADITGGKRNFVAPKVHVLVVDDNLMNIRVIESLLAKYQIRVTSALSGEDGLEKIKERCYDFVFMDHMMPEMDGVETLHRIREIGGKYCETVPIVALTANAIAGVRKMLIAEGFSDFLEKPVECSALERLLLRILPEEKIETVKEAQADTAEKTEKLSIGDLDVAQGMVYCGGKEKYIGILKEFAAKGEENFKPLEALFERQDWRNYVISVHAVKSSMLTIGAKALSEMAKALESEGKKENISYILAHHEEMIKEYRRVIEVITASPFVAGEERKETKPFDLPELTEEEFESYAIAFEDAMYGLDGSKMLEIIDSLEKYMYHGTVLKLQLVPIRHKVEMSDLMSAVEALLQLRDRLKNKR